MVNEVPVPSGLPPVDAAYQVGVPPLLVAPKVNVPASHRVSGVVLIIVGVVVTIATTGVLDVLVHPPLVVST